MHDPSRGYQCSYCPVKLTVKVSLVWSSLIITFCCINFIFLSFTNNSQVWLHMKSCIPGKLRTNVTFAKCVFIALTCCRFTCALISLVSSKESDIENRLKSNWFRLPRYRSTSMLNFWKCWNCFSAVQILEYQIWNTKILSDS